MVIFLKKFLLVLVQNQPNLFSLLVSSRDFKRRSASRCLNKKSCSDSLSVKLVEAFEHLNEGFEQMFEGFEQIFEGFEQMFEGFEQMFTLCRTPRAI